MNSEKQSRMSVHENQIVTYQVFDTVARKAVHDVAEQPTVLDLFCGVGGFSLGAVRAGFRLIGSVDWDKDALRMHEVNFPRSPHWKVDLLSTSAQDIQNKFDFKQVDGVIGGPPCQGFSRMGHQRPDDSRNVLFAKFFALVSDLHPKFFLAENVLGLLDAKNEDLVNHALSLVRSEYVVLKPLILTASRYGIPTTRTRVFFLGVRKGLGVKISEKDILNGMPKSGKVTVAEALCGLPARIRATSGKTNNGGWRKLSARCLRKGFFYERIEGCIPPGVGDPTSIFRLVEKSEISGNQGTIHSSNVKIRWNTLGQGKQDPVSKARRLELNGFCHTIRAGTGREMGSFQALRPIHPTANRVITPREAARLQSFPDWFQFDSTKWQSFRQIGNSVCPILAEKLLVSLRALMENYHG